MHLKKDNSDDKKELMKGKTEPSECGSSGWSQSEGELRLKDAA